VRRFNPETDKESLLPTVYYLRLEESGMPKDVMEDARAIYPRLANKHLVPVNKYPRNGL